jgi:hypothetical protein
MNEQQLAALKLALEALEIQAYNSGDEKYTQAITSLQSIISQDALHKMAEDAVTIGLSYNDWDKIGCVNHDCDKCKAVQESVAKVYRHGESGNGTPWHGIKWLDEGVNMPDGTLLYTAPPAAQKPWVGLTEEEIEDTFQTSAGYCGGDFQCFARAIEAKLKEKNT